MNARWMIFSGPWAMIALVVLSGACNSSSSPVAPTPAHPSLDPVQPPTTPVQSLTAPDQPAPLPRTFPLYGHVWGVADVALSASGHLALSGDRGGFLRLWDVATGDLLRTMRQTADIQSVSLSADGRVALSSNSEGMRIWDTSTGELLRKFGHNERGEPGHGAPPVALSANGHFVLSIWRGIAYFWDAKTGKLLRSFDHGAQGLYNSSISDAALSTDGRFALLGDEGGTLLYWDTTTGNVLHTLVHVVDGSHSSMTTVSLSADGRYALSGTRHGIARLWDLETGEQLRIFDHNEHGPSYLTTYAIHNGVRLVALSADGHLAISVAGDGHLRLWSSSSDAPVRTFDDPIGLVWGVALNAQGSIAMTGSSHDPYRDDLDEGIVHLWDMTRDDPKWQIDPANYYPRTFIQYTVSPSSTASGNYAMQVSLKGWFTEITPTPEDADIHYQWELRGPTGDLIDSREEQNWTAELTRPGQHTVKLTVTKDNAAPLVSEETFYLPDTKQPTAVISGLPEVALGPKFIELDGSASSDEDGEIMRYYWQITNHYYIDEKDSWSGTLSPGTHEISLTVVDEDGARDTAKKTIHLEPSPDHYKVSVYNDNVIVLDVDKINKNVRFTDLDPSAILAGRSQVILTHFEDAFDFLLFFSNFEEMPECNPAGSFSMQVQNLSRGIGRIPLGAAEVLGFSERLQRILRFPCWFALESAPVLHEIMHTWSNYIITTPYGDHFGFSSANGQTGGFDAQNLKRVPEFDQDDGEAWVVAGPDASANPDGRYEGGPYSPIELYLAGLLPIEEVPTLRIAPKARGLYLRAQGETSWDHRPRALDEDGNAVWIVPGWEEYTPERIVREFGERIPPFGEARTEFRAAVILLTDEDHPATEERLKALSAQVAVFSRKGDDGADTINFHEATGGRATITMDGLGALKKPVPALPRFKDSDP